MKRTTFVVLTALTAYMTFSAAIAADICPPQQIHIVDTLIDELDGPDQGTGLSLREAVAAAGPDDVILFDPALADGTIFFTLGPIDVTTSLTIDGDVNNDGSADITLDGQSATRMIEYAGAPDDRLRIQHVDFRHGRANREPDESGGAVRHASGWLELHRCGFYDNFALRQGGAVSSHVPTVQVVKCVFERNKANRGGAFRTLQSSVTTPIIIDGCRFEQNVSRFFGGALILDDPGTTSALRLTDSTFRGNVTEDELSGGGAIYATNAEIARCMFVANRSPGIFGGGATLLDGNCTIRNTRFEDNWADQAGGAIAHGLISGDTLDIDHVAFVANAATFGAVLQITTTTEVHFKHCTLLNNTAVGLANEIYVFALDPRLVFDHTVVGQSGPPHDPPLAMIDGFDFEFVSAGHNLFTRLTMDDLGPTDILGGFYNDAVDPTDDRPASNSDSRDAGDASLVAGQGGVAFFDLDRNQRVAGPGIDIGAYERDAPSTLVSPSVTSVTRLDPNPTTDGCVRFQVTFSAPIDGGSPEDFVAVTSCELAGPVVKDVAASGPDTLTVTVTTGVGDGTLGLDVRDDDSIIDAITRVPLGGFGNGNGDFTGGETYSVRAGDAPCTPNPADLDHDQDVDMDDYNLFLATYGKGVGDAGYNADADYDGDDFVGMIDFGIWYDHYLGFANS